MTKLRHEDRTAANQTKAEAILQSRVMPAFAQITDELHRPDQQQVVTSEETSPNSAELTVAGRLHDTGGGAKAAETLRYTITIAYGPQSIVVKRTVNGKEGSFLGQTNFDSLTSQAIVDDVQRAWRKAQHA